jgi:arginine decarboxylase
MFHQFFGENLLRADVCNAVDELGGLLDHSGPVAAAERNAARIFGADHLFFVTNGTSTSNKIVWNYVVAPGDVVVVDRNCHKSVLHAITMTGAIPVFLTPTRNHYGIIGPIPLEEFRFDSVARRIRNHPLVQGTEGKPRILTLTQSTYDGIVYNVEAIKAELDGRIDSLHFDEAWLPHAAFSGFYRDMHAIGGPNAERKRAAESMIFSTQSTHKLLAGLSQASQILIQDSTAEKLDRSMFNEAFLMHTSTSPQYAIIASCDVAAAMMEPPGGSALVEESLNEALDFRRAMRKIDDEYGDSWWFQVWGPQAPIPDGPAEREHWMLRPNESWHGFGDVAPGFNMLDPIKATIIMPGLEVDGVVSEDGIPAAVLTKYLTENGVVVEKTGLYSFFVMFTIGITKGRWNTLVTELQQFKDDYDSNQPLWRVMPEFLRKQPSYERLGLRDLCDAIHKLYRANDIARLTTEMYLSEMEPVMIPAEARARMTHNEVDRVSIDELDGRISAVLLTPYPPGIPLLIPGERINARIVNYLRFARSFNTTFPGFENEIHGLVKRENGRGLEYFVDCVRDRR